MVIPSANNLVTIQSYFKVMLTQILTIIMYLTCKQASSMYSLSINAIISLFKAKAK